MQIGDTKARVVTPAWGLAATKPRHETITIRMPLGLPDIFSKKNRCQCTLTRNLITYPNVTLHVTLSNDPNDLFKITSDLLSHWNEFQHHHDALGNNLVDLIMNKEKPILSQWALELLVILVFSIPSSDARKGLLSQLKRMIQDDPLRIETVVKTRDHVKGKALFDRFILGIPVALYRDQPHLISCIQGLKPPSFPVGLKF